MDDIDTANYANWNSPNVIADDIDEVMASLENVSIPCLNRLMAMIFKVMPINVIRTHYT